MKTYKKGISLIVLVITVIVLSILATTVIISLNNTDIINKANEAVNKNNMAAYEEQAMLAYAGWLADNGGKKLVNISELEAYGFKSDDLPSGTIAYLENGVPQLALGSTWNGNYPTSTNDFILSGTGDESNPYIISSAEEFAFLSSYVNAGNNMQGKYIKLTKNIDLANKLWTPIGTPTKPFEGHFDGGNNTIYNININVVSNAGIFGYGYMCEIKNLVLANGSVVATGNNAGALIGQISYSEESTEYNTIYNIINKGVDVTGNTNVAGICGLAIAYPLYNLDGIYNVINYGNVKAMDGTAACFANVSYGALKNSNNYGTIEGKVVNAFMDYDGGTMAVDVANNKNYGDIVAETEVKFIGAMDPNADWLYSANNNYNYGKVTVSSGENIDWNGVTNQYN